MLSITSLTFRLEQRWVSFFILLKNIKPRNGDLMVSKMGPVWYRWKAWEFYFLAKLSLRKLELERKSYGSRKSRRPSCFSTFFRRRFLPNGRCYWRTESCMSYPKLQFFLKFRTYGSTRNELGRIYVRRRLSKWKPVRFPARFSSFRQFSRARLT